MLLLKCGLVHFTKQPWVQTNQFGLNFLQESLDLPFLSLLYAAVWVHIQSIKVWFTRT